MSRINTNVTSLNAQKVLARSNTELQRALTRLSTGLRINSSEDDPAGLIAAEVLHSDIVSTGRAITNTQRANEMIATADSALGQVSNLLNDIRALITEAASSGTLSPEQIEANQLQIDASLEAIDRIANSTEFQGRRLLDGSLDFVTHDVDTTRLSDLQIAEANFGNQTEISVAVDIHAQATQAQLNYASRTLAEDVTLNIGGKEGYEAFNFVAGMTIEDIAAAINVLSDSMGVHAEVDQDPTPGTITASSFAPNSDITLTAKIPGEQPGNYRLKFVADSDGGALNVTHVAPVGDTPGTITVALETEPWAKPAVTVRDTSSTDNGLVFTSQLDGAMFNQVRIYLVDNGTGTGGSESVAFDIGSRSLTIGVASGVTTAQQVMDAVNNDPKVSKLFSAALVPGDSGSGTVDVTNEAWTSGPMFTGGINGGASVSTADEVLEAMQHNHQLNELVEVGLAAGNDGSGIVSPFEDYALYGDPEANNRLQFLAPAGTRNVRFVSKPGQALGVDLTTDPHQEGNSRALVQGIAPHSSVMLESNGAGYDGVTIRYHDRGTDTADSVVYRPKEKMLDVYVQQGTATAQTVADLINNDSYVGAFFSAYPFDDSMGTGVIADDDYNANLATLAGSVINEGTIIVNLATDADGNVTTTAQDLVDYFKSPANAAVLGRLGISLSNAEGSTGSGTLAPTEQDLVFTSAGSDIEDSPARGMLSATYGTNSLVWVGTRIPGPEYGNVQVICDGVVAPGNETAEYDSAAKILHVSIAPGVTTADEVIAAINTSPETRNLFYAQRGWDHTYHVGDGQGVMGWLDGGQLSSGLHDFGTQDGAAFLDNADQGESGLSFVSNDYGSDAFVSVESIGGGPFVVTNPAGEAATRSAGTDVDATVNGVQAVGRGLQATVNTSTLNMTFSVAESVRDGSSTAFTVVGGGAQFQLGIDVDSGRTNQVGSEGAGSSSSSNEVVSQETRLGIFSVNTARLGGVSGYLAELRSGGPKSLENDVYGAARVLEEAAAQISTLRGRLGAFQKTTLETNVSTLSDTLENLTDAESTIRDADFATETAQLTRAQILVQSGVSVLKIANSAPEMVLQLLQNQ